MQARSIVLGLIVGVLVGGVAGRFVASRSSQPVVTTDAESCSGLVVPITDKELTDRCYLVWSHSADAVFANTYLGVRTLQNPLDAWITHEIIHERKPDFILDVGTYHGGSAALWATYLEEINPEGRVISIDIEDQVTAAKDLSIVKRRVDFLVGSSTDPELVAEIGRRIDGHEVLVMLDSLHTKEHVYNELVAYAPYVKKGGYIIVQDTPLDRYEPEALRAEGYTEKMIEALDSWIASRPFATRYHKIRKLHENAGAGAGVAAFLETTDEFVIDKGRERLLLTNNWNGYLKRVK